MTKPNAVEKIAADLLSKYNKNDLRRAVRENTSLANLINSFMPHGVIRTIRLIAGFYKSDGHLLNATNVLNWLAVVRPDLHQTILESQENLIWYNKQLRDIKRLFLG